jgi:hypothetical protein
MAELFTLDEAAAIAELEPDTVRTALEKRAVTPSRKIKTGKVARYRFSEGDVLFLLVLTDSPSPFPRRTKTPWPKSSREVAGHRGIGFRKAPTSSFNPGK